MMLVLVLVEKFCFTWQSAFLPHPKTRALTRMAMEVVAATTSQGEGIGLHPPFRPDPLPGVGKMLLPEIK